MTRFRDIVADLAPPLLLRMARRALRGQPRPAAAPASEMPSQDNAPRAELSESERKALVARMDAGDYDFDAETVRRMTADWKRDNGTVPYPSALIAAYSSGDAVAMNNIALMEISYQLPYSHAYEETQAEKYRDLVALAHCHGIAMNGADVADIGCGFGSLLEAVRDAAPTARLHGVECAESALRWIRFHRPHISTIRADLSAATESFVTACGRPMSVVFCTEVLEHLVNPGLGLKNLATIAPHGYVVVTVPNGRADTAAQHINFWSPESWAGFIANNNQGRRYDVLRCPNKNSPGGFENMAILRPDAAL